MRHTFILICMLSGMAALAQNFTVSGTIRSASDQSTVPGASVILLNPSDSVMVKGNVTDFDGNFFINAVPGGEYILQIDFVGFQTYYETLQVSKDLKMDTLSLEESTKMLEAVQVVAKHAAAMQKGDTAQFSAGAYVTAPDASGQELVEKLPGVTMQDGVLQANGEDVQQILVDGKPFFGNDVKAALQNLPAEVIASIQIFDKKSDKAALSGFDDGEQQKTINIITKPSRRRGQFGKSTAGIGTGATYQAGASVNFFNNDRRITVTGLSNNINTINYTADPNSLGDTRTQNGLIKTNNIGLNFSDNIGSKLELHASYQYSRQENENSTNKVQDYTTSSDSGQVYKEDSHYERLYNAHWLNAKLEYKMDENNTLLMRPNVSFQHSDVLNDFQGVTSSSGDLLNSTDNTSKERYHDYDYNNDLYYSHKFHKPGRSLTSGFHTGWHTNEDHTNRYATNIYYSENDSTGILDQQTNRERTGISWSAQTSYTEPVGEHSLMELEYKVGDRIDDSDKRTYDADDAEQYTRMDTTISNTFKSRYLTQEFEVGYQYQLEKLKVQVETEYQLADMKNDQQFPQPFDQRRRFSSLLPSAKLNYDLSGDRRIEINYNTWTNEPSISDLQNVIDNSNPLQLRTGNPELNQTYYHRGRARFWSNDFESGKSVYASLEARVAKDLITSTTFIADEATEVAPGIVLEEGAQLTQPANVDGYYNVHSYVSFGEPVDLLKSNFNINGGVDYTRRPGYLNDQINYSNSSRLQLGISLSSNISENLDFNVGTRSSYHIIENSLRPSLNSNYYNQITNIKYRWVFLGGFVYRADLRHQLNTGLSQGYDNSSLLLNMSAGRKFMKDDKAEISINVYDLLKQNNNVGRSVNELYVEDRQSTVLQRYFMLTFTYNIRHFSAGTTMEDFGDI